MKKIFLLVLLPITAVTAIAQRNKQISVAITNHNSAMPFGKFGGLFTAPFHPGFEVGYGFNWKTKKRHDWFQAFKAGYFYHRFVQHGIPVYSAFGYRYKFNSHWSAETSLGAGYMHSIPATAKLKLNQQGNYENNKGIGRMQAMAAVNIGVGYKLNPTSNKPITIFSIYQQRLQMPFINNYVPMLPYNSILFGIKSPLK